ncbi:GAF domain-containing sensor histidine kinase [Maribacter sp. 1_MG-2023]|uniref:sensor histidine kinase n=1 Tax=Maribacter sp. 1_MG-2023 TaxID=3062677 RepID=UPI0026E3CEBB|nr:GAF domain-containing sensor histidine kinase [Maribacter sp. 1_MG-2023]MDO6472287.1 GAF domain-containing sensor histidine kinase [Maribacter sp. 1_MG-2023]
MVKPEIPNNEQQRLEALKSFNILDTLEEKEYDAITRIAADICNTPMALVSLVDEGRQWFKSHHGLDATETPRDLAFCAHAINTPDSLLLVHDASKDERFSDNPLVTGGPSVQFYAGAPLNTKDGESIGTLCVIDTKPRAEFTERQQASLKDLADQVMAQLELRRQHIKEKIVNEELRIKNNQLKQLSYRMAHDMKTPLLGISSVVGFIKEDYTEFFKDTEIPNYLGIIDNRVEYMESLINGIINYNAITNADIKVENFNVSKELQHVLNTQSDHDTVQLNLENCDHNIKHSLNSFDQIFRDLISNSIKFTDKSDIEINVSFSEDQNFYSFTFEDNGPGIPEKYWEKVFVLFEKLGTDDTKNTGIGLTTIKELIEKLGGSITLGKRKDNKEGVHFSFTVSKNLS